MDFHFNFDVDLNENNVAGQEIYPKKASFVSVESQALIIPMDAKRVIISDTDNSILQTISRGDIGEPLVIEPASGVVVTLRDGDNIKFRGGAAGYELNGSNGDFATFIKRQGKWYELFRCLYY